jgi:uncharacterized YigZ family protein
MELADTYLTVEKNAEGLFKDKGSKFLSYLYFITDEEQVKAIIAQLKKEHHSARHHCYAYRIGFRGEKYRMNDDGEPSGTAGKPIYGQLLSHNLTNILVVVVRYFGGTLLGVSGLINAYKNATIDVIQHAEIAERIIELPILLTFDYQVQNQVMKIIKDEMLEIVSSDYGILINLKINVRLNKFDNVAAKLKKIEGVKVEEKKS